MATLTDDSIRTYELGDRNAMPVIASDIIYEGAAVGDNGSGYARPLVAGDPFCGFAVERADNSSGSAGDINVKVIERGYIKASVTGVTGVGDKNSLVYMSDDNTFTLTSTSNSHVGWISRHVSGTTAIVRFDVYEVLAKV